MISTIVKPLSAQSVLLCKPSSHARRVVCHSRYSFCSGSSLDQGNCFASQTSELQELAHKCPCSIVDCPEPEVALDFEFPFLCGFGAGVFVALALAVILCYLCSCREVRTDKSNVGCSAQDLGSSCRIQVSRIVSSR